MSIPSEEHRVQVPFAKFLRGALVKRKICDDGPLGKLEIKRGDRVLFGKFAATEVTLDGPGHRIICTDDVLGIVNIGG